MKNYLIITGASQGIGKSTAKFFLENEWQVINISRHPCDISGVYNFTLDLSQNDLHVKDLKSFIDHDAKICLVHNAAHYVKDNIDTLSQNELIKSLQVNVIAPTILNQIFMPKMTTGSSIIYIGSTLSEMAVPNTASYVITKHAVVGLMRATCQDLNPGIHTCCICPGFVDTKMMRSHLKNNPEIIDAIKNRVKANRLVLPEEIASLIYYCANNPVINGAVLHANLGQIVS